MYKYQNTFAYFGSFGSVSRKFSLSGSIQVHPAFLVNLSSNPNLLLSKSKAKICPLFPIKLATCEVLFPGAAQPSITTDPGGGFKT